MLDKIDPESRAKWIKAFISPLGYPWFPCRPDIASPMTVDGTRKDGTNTGEDCEPTGDYEKDQGDVGN